MFAEKLESLMVLTFNYLKSCSENGRLFQVKSSFCLFDLVRDIVNLLMC